jgi:Spy/CpxP family protein refolding chaperone
VKRTTLIYALVLLVALTAIVAVAQGRRANAPVNQPSGCFATCQKALGLSQSQVDEMTGLRTAFVNDTATLRADLQAKMKEIADLWLVADPDLQLIKQKAAEADQIRAEIRDKAIDTRGAVLKVLTPEQRATCIKRCQSGQCGCGMCGGLGMGMGMCGMNGAGCMGMGGQGMGRGCGGTGMGMGRGMGRGMGPTGTGCPFRQ